MKSDSLCARLRKSQGFASGESYEAATASFSHEDVLVIDEVAANRSVLSESDYLFSVLDCRYTMRKAVVIVSNLKWKALEGFLGERSSSRIAENCVIVEMTGVADYRRRKK